VGIRVGFSAQVAPLRVRADNNVARKRAPKGVPAGKRAKGRMEGETVLTAGDAVSGATQRILRGIVPTLTANEDSVMKIWRSIPLERRRIHSAHRIPETRHAR
jgi:hypothetical protein